MGVISSVALDATRVLVVYGSPATTAVVLVIDGANITPGTAVVGFDLNSNPVSLCLYDTDKVIVCLTSGSKGVIRLLSISGDVITVGEQSFVTESSAISYVVSALLSSSKFVVGYTYSGDSKGYALVLDIVDGVITGHPVTDVVDGRNVVGYQEF
jgi:hypothetical protein